MKDLIERVRNLITESDTMDIHAVDRQFRTFLEKCEKFDDMDSDRLKIVIGRLMQSYRPEYLLEMTPSGPAGRARSYNRNERKTRMKDIFVGTYG